jgi:protein-tyrosine phosphatase
MIDLHSHILPGLDDGALDLRDSLAMARVAAGDGIGRICATPHIRADHDVRIRELPSRVAALNRALDEAGIAVRVLPGGEVAEPIVDTLADDELELLCLGGTGRWVLLEPRAGPLGGSLVATVRTLGERGYSCVIAHPERHLGPAFEQRLAALAEAGALVQATAAHLTEEGGDFLVELFRRGLLHVLGSDAHSSHGGRPLKLSSVERLRDLAHFDWIATEAPEAIVAGERVVPPVAPAPL